MGFQRLSALRINAPHSSHVPPFGPGRAPGVPRLSVFLLLAALLPGVSRATLEPLPEHLNQKIGTPLDPLSVRDSLRRLFATGLYQTIAVDGQLHSGGVILTFTGAPTRFIGRVLVRGVKNFQLSNQLSYSTRLAPGTPFTAEKVTRARNLLQTTLQEDGYYRARIVHRTAVDYAHALEDIQFNVTSGNQAHVGNVSVQGDSGLSLSQFRKRAKLRQGAKVSRDTVTRALTRLRKYYQKQHRLEPTIRLLSRSYNSPVNRLDFHFQDDRGPIVRVSIVGVKIRKPVLRNLVPIYAEGTFDEDLLNAGSRRIRDFLQRKGYFDAKVTHSRTTANGATHIVYHVVLGDRERLVHIGITGNHYFDSETIRQRLGVETASFFFPYGTWSLALQQAGINAVKALYQSNGFTDVKITPTDHETRTGKNKVDLTVTYHISEGPQQRVGLYKIEGVTPAQLATLRPMMGLQRGQPYSDSGLATDRNTILGYFLDNGYDHARVTVTQHPEPADPNIIDVHLIADPGHQIFIRKVLLSGLHYTRTSTVDHDILVRPGQPLDQAKLLETQRRLYNLTLFNQVNTAVENPAGDQSRKNVLVQFDEARRWDVVYGVGFQAQTGTPSQSCPNALSLVQLGINPATYACSPNGRTGVSALVNLDVSRINLFGRNQSISFRGRYGTLEQEFTTNYSAPRFLGRPNFNFSFGGGYINAQNVITFASSTAEGDIRLTQRPNLVDTLIYQVTYRRVRVDPNTVQVAPNLIPIVSEPVRVGGPELTWIHDTRRPQPLNASTGVYNSIQEFVTDHSFLDSEANFNHFDWTNSSYYALGRNKNFIIARNTRYGQERVFGESRYEAIPLPERLYAGGPESLRGFALNSAGPRDSLTGFPIGGAAVFVNQTELRFPYPRLPWFGKSLGFVLFHDMGNVFNSSSDIWPSFFRVKQPHSYTCTAKQYLNIPTQEKFTRSSSTNPRGTCDFNDFSQTLGLGVRYYTPIGPIRFDIGYNLNPPVYPVLVTYGSPPSSLHCYPGDPTACWQQAPHLNFFFSIGQAF